MTEAWTLVFLVSVLNGLPTQGGAGSAGHPDAVHSIEFRAEADCRAAQVALAKEAKVVRAACYKGPAPKAD